MKKLLSVIGCMMALSASAQIGSAQRGSAQIDSAQPDSAQLMKDVQTLSADKMEGRKTGTKGNRMAQFYLLDRLKEIGLEQFYNTYQQSFFFNSRGSRIMGTNLYGYIKGEVDSFIVISAHYDHVGTKAQPPGGDSIYNGADDNASGVAGLLAIAKYFKAHPPRYSLIFAAFDAEEMGLQGAKDFSARLPVPAANILLNINMDMISHNDKRELYVCGTYHYPQLKPYVTAAAAKSAILLPMGHDKPEDAGQDWTSQSDHHVFHLRKIPFLYFGVEDHPDYHKVTDEFSRINPSFFYQAVLSILDVVKAVNERP